MMETPHHTRILKWRPVRLLHAANIGGTRAARLKSAACRESGNGRHHAFDFLQP
jgi:hypothetical protein